jgi:hypothetical protein
LRNETWDEWEWENPPLAAGVAYRTTERYAGKPVYVKTVELGAFPDGVETHSVAHGESNITPIRCTGTATSPESGTVTLPVLVKVDNVCFMNVEASREKIYCRKYGIGMSDVTITATMWFTRG